MIASFISRVWASDELLAVILAASISLVGWVLVRMFTLRGRVAWAVSHQHAFNLQNLTPPTLVHTREMWVQNVGRARVDSVEVVLNFAPGYYDIWPQRQFSTQTTPNNNFVLTFDNLNPREFFTISLFQITNQPPMTTNVRWSGGVGEQRQMAPQQVVSRARLNILGFLILMGFFAIFYFVVRLVQWL
jgi:hypothetical protein